MIVRYRFIAILHIVLVFSFLYIFDYKQENDAWRYKMVADEFASFTFHFSPEMHCNTAPGYPLFLAILKPITRHNIYMIALMQALLFLYSFKYFIHSVAKRYSVSKKAIGLLVCMVLLHPEIIHLNGYTLTESLAASMLLLLYGAIFNEVRNPKGIILIVLSTLILVFTKMEYLAFLLILVPFLFWLKMHKTLIITIAALVILFTVNGLRNQLIYGEFKFTSYGSGTVIYGGNNLLLDGSWHVPGFTKNYIPDLYTYAFDALQHSDEASACIRRDSMFKVMAIEAWKADIGNQLKVIPLKFSKLWLLPGNIDIYTLQKEGKKGVRISDLWDRTILSCKEIFLNVLYLLFYWSALIISLIGVYLKINIYRIDKMDMLIFSLLLIHAMLYSIPFYGLGRFHLPVIAILFYYSVYVFNLFINTSFLYKFKSFKETYIH
ncbi:MAG: hypothetical protein MUE33_12465 [Cytophagaceae bacterium]|nr:hypothetical protein [Cytophagaceae bacterium]